MKDYVIKEILCGMQYIQDKKEKILSVMRRLFVCARLRAVLVYICIFLVLYIFAIPIVKYVKADSLAGDNPLEAALIFSELDDFLGAGRRADECYFALGSTALEHGDYSEALSFFARIHSADILEQFRNAIFQKAILLSDCGWFEPALTLLENIPDHPNSAMQYQKTCYKAGVLLLGRGNYAEAYRYFSLVTFAEFPDAATQKKACIMQGYDALVKEYRETGLVPDGFSQDYLKGYEDTEKFLKLAILQKSDWAEAEFDRNLDIIYELGDFENMEACGFAAYRVMDYRWSGNGYYLYIDMFGTVDSNLPQYRLSGYYGLYIKFDNGVMYIGSDEKAWTNQFGFTFSNHDETLSVYCFSSGQTFTLYKEHSV